MGESTLGKPDESEDRDPLFPPLVLLAAFNPFSFELSPLFDEVSLPSVGVSAPFTAFCREKMLF